MGFVMKRINKNAIAFVIIVMFIISGLWGDGFIRLWNETLQLGNQIVHGNIFHFIDYKDALDDISVSNLSYHDQMMDVNSIKDNLLGTRVIHKDDAIVVKADSGSLISERLKVSDTDIQSIVERISELKSVAEDNGANFLYCAAPQKELYEHGPENVVNYSKDNYLSFLFEMENKHIPYLDFSISLKNNGIPDNDIFYYTDHHWKAYSGFVATKALCEELESRYGFTYNKDYTYISHNTVETYPNWFLGSRGKKVGTFFTWHGADNFDIITPNFQTSFVESQPIKNEERKGRFEETVLFMDNMEKDYYHNIPYSTYSGGDFRLQIIKNNLNPDGEKILLIRDSFACVVAPFLALQTSELHILDMRDYEYYVGDKLNVEEYIKEIRPDYVIVLYSGITSLEESHGRYDFF